jgi:hypothetical protein
MRILFERLHNTVIQFGRKDWVGGPFDCNQIASSSMRFIFLSEWFAFQADNAIKLLFGPKKLPFAPYSNSGRPVIHNNDVT